MFVAELFRQGVGPTPLDADEDALLWKLIEDYRRDYDAGRVSTGAMVSLGLTWKGTSGFLGWGGVAPALPAARCGPFAYLLGLRYVRVLNKPVEAAKFFRTAVADAGTDARLRRLAQREIDRLKPR